ncbi:MAG: ribbon-helix-helix protein, CopG family [Candidatus Helarchaeota archaeon]|nr:ribbon-helix-helix protein, CopG family [Candidatus Helarchaeota archaeon]
MKLIQTSITLPLKYINLIEELVKNGKFPSKVEVIRVAIRRAIKRDKKRLLSLEKK